MLKLQIEKEKVTRARELANSISQSLLPLFRDYSSDSIERSLIRLLGVDGENNEKIPFPNIVVDFLKNKGHLEDGILYWFINGMIQSHKTAQELSIAIDKNEINLFQIPIAEKEEIFQRAEKEIQWGIRKIDQAKERRQELLEKYPNPHSPLLYVIVATGNIREDVPQARAAAGEGADIIAVIRSTAQSLLDYIPYGETTEGFGGTYATQENFKIMRDGLDEIMEKEGRYLYLTNYASGLCMPEIAAMGAFERLDVMLNDALYGILFRDINMQRTIIDQYFSRVINGFAGVIINTGEDNYLTTADAFEQAHTVLASDLINEQLALIAGIPEEQMGLGHAFEMDPELKNGFLYELAQAQMLREIFPKAPLKYMPPTKFMTGNIFRGHVQDALFNQIAIMTNQGIQLLGMMTEAIHTPFMSDRYLSIENARYIFNNMKDISSEIEFKEDGIIQQRAKTVLSEANELLKKVNEEGLFKSLEKGVFADVKRPFNGGKGLNGVFEKSEKYFNPFIESMLGDDRK